MHRPEDYPTVVEGTILDVIRVQANVIDDVVNDNISGLTYFAVKDSMRDTVALVTLPDDTIRYNVIMRNGKTYGAYSIADLVMLEDAGNDIAAIIEVHKYIGDCFDATVEWTCADNDALANLNL